MKHSGRRVMASLAFVGVVALLLGWALLSVERYHRCGNQPVPGPCDPSTYLPFAWVAILLWAVASIALLVLATWLVTIGIRGVIRHDARMRAANRAQGE
jgi:hypothetical protein